ncbi:dipeptidase [Corynebacterium sp.]|uniref:dipeptidase n=1 Tax=Corynebacterium sp. TaxID=1720 RepID=UPI0026DBD1ED|nr:dipeptidase [Corynebacterium sp.]MDO4610738.1 dipeptidase [Corynebacterium sp.]
MTNTIPQTLRASVEADRAYVKESLTELVAFPSVHGDPETEAACREAAEAVRGLFKGVGIDLDAHVTVDGSIALTGHVAADEGMPTVLLYSHYDVQPAGDVSAWTGDPWTLEERDGRWYGRGTADCKGNVVMHLAAIRALGTLRAENPGHRLPGLRIVVEGSEERGSAGLHDLIATRPELFQADVILIADVGNVAVGEPTLITTLRGSADVDVRVDTLRGPVHSGMFGGPAPDALAALMRLLDSLRDEAGATAIDGLDCAQTWEGGQYDPETFRGDAGVLDGVDLISDHSDASVADLTWARPTVIVTGIDCPPATNAVNAVPSTATAHINLRVPPGMDPQEAQDRLVEHLEAHVPWHARLTIERDGVASPFAANVEGDVVRHLESCLSEAYGRETVRTGEGGSIPLCATLLEAVPDADLALFGVEEPLCRIHSADESVSPDEIRDIAVSEALFLATLGEATGR